MSAKKKQVQPRSGPERAFGDVGFPRERLAFEAEFDRTTISLMERGLISPTLRTMNRLRTILRLPLSQLAKQIEESELF